MAAFNRLITAGVVLIFGLLCFGSATFTTSFFVGTFVTNAISSCQTNMWQTYETLGAPTWLIGETGTIDIQPAGQNLFRLVETYSPSGLLIQDMYFKLGVQNTTWLPGNIQRKFIVTTPDSHTLQLDYTEVITGITTNITINFGPFYKKYTLTDRVGSVTGSRSYVKNE